jgi:hypothetical protein
MEVHVIRGQIGMAGVQHRLVQACPTGAMEEA